MDFKTYIKDYAKKADKALDTFFQKKIADVEETGKSGKGAPIAIAMLKKYREFSQGGKKLRGALIQLGYEIAGGDKREVISASTSIELIHSFLLMHDDVIDSDEIRRGAPTIHKYYEKGNSPHHGTSMAILMGDLGAYLGMEVLLDSSLNPENKNRAALYFSRLLEHVCFGQGLDITYERVKGITEDNVLEVHLHKTSIYTVEGPLKVGAILGGAPPTTIEAIEKFGRPVGIAFQLRDDELGLFSDEKTLGKPIGGDIKEGKVTILHIKALELARGEDRQFLKYAYGNTNIAKEDVKRVCEITKKCGVFAYSQDLSRKLVNKGKMFIPGITKDKNFAKMFSEMADFMIQRES